MCHMYKFIIIMHGLCNTVCRQVEIVPFFTVIETERSYADKILDYSISQTTLEEVFLNVCHSLTSPLHY